MGVEMSRIEKNDGNIHVVPDHEDHEESENCWCTPKWEDQNKNEWRSGEAVHKVFVHRTLGETAQ